MAELNRMETAYWSGSVAGAVVGAAVGAGGVALMSHQMGDYGNVVFVGLPIVQGMVAAYITQQGGPRSWKVCAGSAMFSLLLSALVVLIFAIEGIVCLIMASPLIVGLALLGSWLGWLMGGGEKGRDRALMPLVPLAAIGLTMGGGAILPAPESQGEVTTVWHLAAPPERIWPYVLSLSSLPEPDWWLFRAGVAHPLRTRTFADGSRECVLSTGVMPEEVTERVENRRLIFRVLSTPPSMKEMNPFGEVHAPHLNTVYRSKEGEFLLIPEGAGTKIVARSSYALRIGPAWYWQLWTDAIVRHVHERVIREIGIRVATR